MAGKKFYRVRTRYIDGPLYEYVEADDVVIQHSELVFRVQSSETNKFETISGYASGEWAGFRRITEEEIPELDQEEEEKLVNAARKAIYYAGKLRGYEMGHGEHHMFDALQEMEQIIGDPVEVKDEEE